MQNTQEGRNRQSGGEVCEASRMQSGAEIRCNGDVKLILAPMAGLSDQPCRRMARLFGADEVVTELISANAFVRENKKTVALAALHEDERPASIQIFGSDPAVMAEAARRVEHFQPLFIDINMGCPAKKVVRNGAGSALLENPARAAAIVKAVSDAVKVPVSIKIRTGKNHQSKTGLDVARLAADAGAKRITVHARTVADRFCGPIDYDAVAQLRADLPHIELIGNGDIHNVDDARRWLERTGVDGLMIGRGAVGHPSIFSAIKRGEQAPDVEDAATIMQHVGWMREFLGDRRCIGPLRAHMMYYSKGLVDARRFRQEVTVLENLENLKELVERFFSKNKEAQCAA